MRWAQLPINARQQMIITGKMLPRVIDLRTLPINQQIQNIKSLPNCKSYYNFNAIFMT